MHIRITFSLLIQIDDDQLKHEKRLVDGFGLLLLCLVVGSARLVNSFRAGQIDQMELGDEFHVGARLFTLDLDHEHAMRPGRRVILGGF